MDSCLCEDIRILLRVTFLNVALIYKAVGAAAAGAAEAAALFSLLIKYSYR